MTSFQSLAKSFAVCAPLLGVASCTTDEVNAVNTIATSVAIATDQGPVYREPPRITCYDAYGTPYRMRAWNCPGY